jgi:tetratricopeptide (TPR) repeat protein
LKEKARCKRLIGELREATQILQKVLSDPHATEETELFIETLRELGVIHFQHGEYDLALNYYHQALQRAKAHQDFLLIAHCLNEIGLVHYYKGQLGTALNFYLESLDLREKSGNQRAIAVVLPNIADAYNKLGEQTKALQHLQKSIEIARKIGDRRLLVISLHNHGDILAEQNQYQQATQQFQHSLQIADELGFTDAANLNRIQLALMQTLTKPEPQHLKQLEQLLKEAEQLENIENQIHANLALAITYHRHKNFEKSKQLFSEALLNAEKIASSHLQQLIKNRMLQFPIRND